MTHHLHMGTLPDPDIDSGFYENVPMKRLIAFVVDFFVIVILSVLVVLGLGLVTFGIGLVFAVPIAFWTAVMYRIVMLTAKSATLGMMAMGIEFRTSTGARFDFVHAAVHSLIFSFLFPTIIAPIISAGMMLSAPYGRSLQDFVLGSTAINRPE